MAGAAIDLANVKVTGSGTCSGGAHHHPPFHDYPLLAWCHAGHEVHGLGVFTEDQKASVEAIAVAVAANPNYEAVAAQFGTTSDHVSQAVDYAIKAGFLGV